MAEIKVVDQALVLKSTISNEKLAKAEKYFPEALVVKEKDEDGKSYPVFRVGFSDYRDEGSVSENGIEFVKGADDTAASVTVLLPKKSKDKMETFVKDEFGKVLAYLMKVEKQLTEAEGKFDKEYADLSKNITIE